ncbi:MAG: hypothetical protein ACM3SV_11545 [Betaproteobacteria bacterium]
MFLEPKDSERLGNIILEPDIQTRIASFLIGIKQYNSLVLSKFELQPVEWIPYALLHGQLYREMELIGLMQHICSWSLNPEVYIKAGRSQLKVYSDLKFSDYLFSPVAADLNFYRYLALSQGLYAHLRFLRLLPLELPLEHKFLVLLRSLEVIHGQQMQGQIQMLRHFPVDLNEDEREIIVGEESERVMKVFEDFVLELVKGNEIAV